MWAAGPPNPRIPSFRKTLNTSSRGMDLVEEFIHKGYQNFPLFEDDFLS
jgi:hypothetical protein